MQMLSHLRAVEDLEPLPLSEAEVILSPGFVVVQSHEQSHSCSEGRGRGARRSRVISGYHCCHSLSVNFVCFAVLLDTTLSYLALTKMPV